MVETTVAATPAKQTNGNVKKSNRRKKAAKATPKHASLISPADSGKPASSTPRTANFEVEYVNAPPPSFSDSFSEFSEVFSKFETRAMERFADVDRSAEDEDSGKVEDALGGFVEDRIGEDMDEDDEEAEAKRMASKKKKKLEQRLSIAQLKQSVQKPDVVDWVDVTAADPKLLVHLKSCRNTVPIPIHWQQKRKYLQGKRGIEKPPFDLPDFIKQTGIMDMRQAVKEKEDASRLKSKVRERVQPKMGRLDIDYQKLHDAFFRWQTKPPLSLHGDMYYEGKEYETKLKFKKPGNLSDELKEALGMHDPTIAPPWLVNMQRYGPPPSYPGLKIPGLTCPIPAGGVWGYQPGGWGKPPVDEYGRPLYGDVFGVSGPKELDPQYIGDIDRSHWGELEVQEEEEEEEEEEEDEQEEDDNAEEPAAPVPESGLVTPSGLASVPSGLETPDFIELRKEKRVDDGPKELYKVIPQKDTSVKGFMGSQHTYDLSSTFATPPPPSTTASSTSSLDTRRRKAAIMQGIMSDKPVAMSLNPEDLQDGLSGDAVKRAYEEKMKAARMDARGEDFSDLVAEHASKQQAKRQKKEKEAKKRDDKFKF